MNRRTVWALLRTELRQVFRDRLAVFMSIVLPLVIMPMVVFSLGSITARRENLMRTGVFSYAVQGAETAAVSPLLEAARSPATKDAAPGTAGPTFRRVDDGNPLASLQAGKLDLVVRLGTTSAQSSPFALLSGAVGPHPSPLPVPRPGRGGNPRGGGPVLRRP